MSRALVKIAILCGVISWTCGAQDAKRAPEFEAASVKPSPPPPPFSVASGQRYTRSDADQFRATYATLPGLIQFAWGVQRISGLSGMDGQYFEIVAKLPAGSTKEEVPAMLQKLLADRFKLSVHRDQKVEPVYELVADKKGVKLKPSAAGAPENCRSWPGQYFCQHITLGQLAAFMSGMANAGARMAAREQPGEWVEHRIDRPVVDLTGLAGVFDIDLQWVPPAGLDSFQTDPAEYPGRPPRDASVNADSIFGALEAVGLRLQGGKRAFDILVVDHVERVPSGN